MEGTVVGGWDYVTASYLIVWGSMIAYTVSLFMRRKRAASDSPPPADLEK